ncbi:MAG: replication restart helicase PriA [Chloroflexota bacterium]
MRNYYEIAVSLPRIQGTFTYHAPPDLESELGSGHLMSGHLVEVPFGRQNVQGVILQKVDVPDVPETRPVTGLFDPQPVLTAAQIALARQLAEETLSPLAAMVDLMIPPGLRQQADTRYSLHPERAALNPPTGQTEKMLVAILQERGPLRGRQLDAALPHRDWRGIARKLVQRGVLGSQAVLPPPTVRARLVRTVQLACPPAEAEAALPALGRGAALARRQAVLRYLLHQHEPVNVAWVYAESGGKPEDLRYLAERNLAVLSEREELRDPLAGKDYAPSQPLALTDAQQTACDEICAALHAGQAQAPFLLHGVTGSGKTEIYLHAIAETLRMGKQAIFLVPEIALTPQTTRRVVGRFPGQVGIVHSQLSPGERYDTWRRARQGQISVIVGPRSALFTPFDRLGLIVLDEFHDHSFYQAEPPFYHARRAAEVYARLAGAVCVFGSATPDVASRNRKDYRYIHLPERIFSSSKSGEAESKQLPPIRVVDMRHELKAGNTSMFSRPLQAALQEVLAKEQQAILFLNRRGTATFVFCRECGASLKCPRCDLPLTLHVGSSEASGKRRANGSNALLCHYCNYERQVPQKCPHCGSAKIRQYGAGTEKVEAEVQAMFPQARTLRWDYETTRQKGAHEAILGHFANQRANVLIGTQMIAKGLDLPRVTLVGIVLADVGLNLPDPFAAERNFQVLTQVAGRAGRSALGGRVILQTFLPEHYVIQAAAGHDYEGFYQQELAYRRKLVYPPFARLARLEIRGQTAEEAETAAGKFLTRLQENVPASRRTAMEIIGPAPCFFSRTGGVYRWQILLRCADPVSLLRGANLSGCRVEIDPPSLL